MRHRPLGPQPIRGLPRGGYSQNSCGGSYAIAPLYARAPSPHLNSSNDALPAGRPVMHIDASWPPSPSRPRRRSPHTSGESGPLGLLGASDALEKARAAGIGRRGSDAWTSSVWLKTSPRVEGPTGVVLAEGVRQLHRIGHLVDLETGRNWTVTLSWRNSGPRPTEVRWMAGAHTGAENSVPGLSTSSRPCIDCAKESGKTRGANRAGPPAGIDGARETSCAAQRSASLAPRPAADRRPYCSALGGASGRRLPIVFYLAFRRNRAPLRQLARRSLDRFAEPAGRASHQTVPAPRRPGGRSCPARDGDIADRRVGIVGRRTTSGRAADCLRLAATAWRLRP